MRTHRKISDLIQRIVRLAIVIFNIDMKVTKSAITVLVATLVWSGIGSAEYFRWKDKNGDTQYGDQVPAEDTSSGRIKVNESGRVVEKVAPALTPEEKRRYEEEQRIAKIEADRKAEQEAYDRVLLATFNSADEIVNVRDERIGLIEQSIKLSRSRLRNDCYFLAC